MITRDDLLAVCPRPKDTALRKVWDGYADAMLSPEGENLFQQYQVNTASRMVMFLGAVVAPETQMTVLRESGKYSASRILAIFGAGHHSSAVRPEEAARIASLPVNADGSGHRCDTLFERVYGLQIAHCCKTPLKCRTPKKACKAREFKNWEPGDGARCRGLGLNQMTGRKPQEAAAKEIGCTLDELATPLNALHMALIEWDEKDCNTWADKGGEQGVIAVRKLVNAGNLKVSVSRVNGIPEAMRAYAIARRVITPDDFRVASDDRPTIDNADHLAAPPASLAHSTEAQVATGTSGGGTLILGNSVKASVMSVAKGGSLSFWAIMVDLLSREETWIGGALVFGGIYMLLKRRNRLHIWGS